MKPTLSRIASWLITMGAMLMSGCDTTVLEPQAGVTTDAQYALSNGHAGSIRCFVSRANDDGGYDYSRWYFPIHNAATAEQTLERREYAASGKLRTWVICSMPPGASMAAEATQRLILAGILTGEGSAHGANGDHSGGTVEVNLDCAQCLDPLEVNVCMHGGTYPFCQEAPEYGGETYTPTEPWPGPQGDGGDTGSGALPGDSDDDGDVWDDGPFAFAICLAFTAVMTLTSLTWVHATTELWNAMNNYHHAVEAYKDDPTAANLAAKEAAQDDVDVWLDHSAGLAGITLPVFIGRVLTCTPKLAYPTP